MTTYKAAAILLDCLMDILVSCFFMAWIQTGSAPVGLKCEPGADFISTGSAYKNRTCAT